MRDFLVELLLRFGSKTPWFFKVVQIISGIISVILVGPDVFDFVIGLGIKLPESWGEFISKAVGVAAAISVFISQLTVTSEEKEKKQLQD